MSDPVLVLREALAKATEGPWFRDYDSVVTRGSDEEDDWPGRWTVAKTGPGTTVSRDPKHLADAQFILAARNLLPVLLDEVEALRKVVDGVKALAVEWNEKAAEEDRKAVIALDALSTHATSVFKERAKTSRIHASALHLLLAVLDKEEEK